MTDPIQVLVVDDDDDVRETLALVLEAEGFRVRGAANGEEALDEIRRAEHSVVLLDLRMPIMSGWEVIDVLRRESRLESVPIVICTSSPQDAPEGFPIIPKPVQLPRLLSIIERAAGT